MAALHEIARQYAEEIRDGIAWVIIWKTGRSWHAESVWLNQDSDTFELEDLSTATEILEQDPNAVMVNGYYCGHFGENMTIAELEAGILWHYEGGRNLLKDLGLYPADDYKSDEYFWLDSNGERVIYRGGAWGGGAPAGVFCLSGSYSRSNAGTSIGFRAACVRFICDSDTLDDLDSDKKQPESKKRSILAPDFIGRIKQALARQFQKLYEAAHGEDQEGFAELAEKATAEELTKAAALSTALAQVNAAVDMYELTAKQLKLAATTSITIKTEVTDHE